MKGLKKMIIHEGPDGQGEAIVEVYDDVAGKPTREMIRAVIERNWPTLVDQLSAEELCDLHTAAIARLGSLCYSHNNTKLACPDCGNTGKEDSIYIRGEVLIEYSDGEFWAHNIEENLGFYAEHSCVCSACDFGGYVYNFLPKK